MRNPLWKRLPRELKSDFGKYIVIFLFMTLTIGFVSGFLVADDSMLAAYGEGFEKYNIEHGNFTLSSKASESDLKKIEKKELWHLLINSYKLMVLLTKFFHFEYLILYIKSAIFLSIHNL